MSDTVDPRLIQELFDQDPLKLSEQDLDTIIAYYRTERQDFLQAEKKPKAAASKSSSKQAVLPLEDISIEDLGL